MRISRPKITSINIWPLSNKSLDNHFTLRVRCICSDYHFTTTASKRGGWVGEWSNSGRWCCWHTNPNKKMLWSTIRHSVKSLMCVLLIQINLVFFSLNAQHFNCSSWLPFRSMKSPTSASISLWCISKTWLARTHVSLCKMHEPSITFYIGSQSNLLYQQREIISEWPKSAISVFPSSEAN